MVLTYEQIQAAAKKKGISQANVDKFAGLKWVSKPASSSGISTIKNPNTPKQNTNVNTFGDVSGANKATKNTGTWVITANKGLQMKPEEFVYWEAAKQKDASEVWYLQKRNDQLANDFYGKGMKDAASIKAELSKNAAFTSATPEEQDNTVQGILNRMGGMTSTTPEVPEAAVVPENAGKYTDAEGNLVDILGYGDLPDDVKQLVDGMTDAQKKEADMLYGNDLNAKAEYYRQWLRTEEYLQWQRDLNIQVRDANGVIQTIQASQRLKDASKQVDNLIQNAAYLWDRWQPWSSGARLQAAKQMIVDAQQKFADMKVIEQKVAQIRELWDQIDTKAFEKQMADISDDLNMKVGSQIQNAMNDMTSADLAWQLDTIDWVTQFKRSLLQKLDANITGYTEGSMKQMQYVTETYQKIADDAQTRLTEWTKNANTVNTDMSTAMGYMVDGNGTPLYNSDGSRIEVPEAPPMPPVYDKASGQLITFSTDDSGQIVAKMQQVTAGQWDWKIQSVNGVDMWVNPVTKQTQPISGTESPTAQWYQWPEIAPVSTQEVQRWLTKYETKPIGSVWGECGSFVNDYLNSIWIEGRMYIDPIEVRKTQTNSDTPTAWSIAVFDRSSDANASAEAQTYGHVAIVTSVNADWSFNTVESNNKGDKKVFKRTLPADSAVGFFDPSKWLKPSTGSASIADAAVKAISLAQFWSEKARDNAIKDIKSLANSWDVNAVQKKLTNIFLSDLWATEKQAFKTNQNTINAMDLISQKLDKIPTSWLNGWFEKLAQKIGESDDPELAKLQIVTNNAMDILRRWRSGAALTEFEEQFYNTMFPTISKSFALNEATIEWLVESLQNNIDSNIQEYYGDDVFNSIWWWNTSSNQTTTTTSNRWDIFN